MTLFVQNMKILVFEQLNKFHISDTVGVPELTRVLNILNSKDCKFNNDFYLAKQKFYKN